MKDYWFSGSSALTAQITNLLGTYGITAAAQTNDFILNCCRTSPFNDTISSVPGFIQSSLRLIDLS